MAFLYLFKVLRMTLVLASLIFKSNLNSYSAELSMLNAI